MLVLRLAHERWHLRRRAAVVDGHEGDVARVGVPPNTGHDVFGFDPDAELLTKIRSSVDTYTTHARAYARKITSVMTYQ